MSSRRNRRHLTEDEKLLWHRVGRTVTPLDPPRAGSVGPSKTPETMARLLAEAEGAAPDAPLPAGGDIRSPFPAKVQPPRQPRHDHRPPIDRPTTRKIAKGRIDIDARIDLHAMTQDQAHDRLYGFLADARSRGMRHVLIVTGKGRSMGSEGVLKRMVPIWLNSAFFRDLVSGYSQASRRHGGEGAIYVRLRRLRGHDGNLR